MNKWQIICPVAVLFGVLLVYVAINGLPGSQDYHYYITVRTHDIGRELIATTNSQKLVELDPALRTKLVRLLSSPTYLAAVLFGDEPTATGGGKACSRLTLTNEAGEGIVLRLRQGTNFDTFHVLSYRTITEPGGPANRGQPFGSETNRTSSAAGPGG